MNRFLKSTPGISHILEFTASMWKKQIEITALFALSFFFNLDHLSMVSFLLFITSNHYICKLYSNRSVVDRWMFLLFFCHLRSTYIGQCKGGFICLSGQSQFLKWWAPKLRQRWYRSFQKERPIHRYPSKNWGCVTLRSRIFWLRRIILIRFISRSKKNVRLSHIWTLGLEHD